MKNSPLRFCILIGSILIASCTPQVTTTEIPSIHSSQSTASAKPFDTVIDFPVATSVALTIAGDTIYMIIGNDQGLSVSRSTDGGRTFTDPISATGNQTAHVLRV